MTNLVPMAGEGRRFSDAGYSTPKPLITVSGEPMIIQAVRGMPASDDWVFVCRKEHIVKYGVDKILRKEIPECRIVIAGKTTEGQASTCLLAKKYIDMNKPLFIGACDNGMVFDGKKWEALTNDESIDAVILTFTRQPNLSRSPLSWGWVEAVGNTAKRISVKIPVSDDPFNDHAVVGSFWFRSGRIFADAAEEMIRKNIRTNNEFYVDSVLMEIIANGGKVVIFDLEQYIGWGTPADLKEYEYWENAFLKGRDTEDKKLEFYGFWKRYFECRG
ncbi:MAG: nucleotidyltransferase [Candidatus Aenigmarchaeota archaeon]|nr:nucleotidyltransferase [Candidatus Aenigmarchaeota archaeon]MDI6722221.1 nucleotidyltransferase [Candidatus Aenigmarchaeota archaeon]